MNKERAQQDINERMQEMKESLTDQTWAKVKLAGDIFDYNTNDGYFSQEETELFKSLLKTVLKKSNFHEVFDWRHKFTQQEIDKIYHKANNPGLVKKFLQALNFLNHHAYIDTHHLLVIARCNSFKNRVPCTWCSEYSSDITDQNEILLTLFDNECGHNVEGLYRQFFPNPGPQYPLNDAPRTPPTELDLSSVPFCKNYLWKHGVKHKLTNWLKDDLVKACNFFYQHGLFTPTTNKHPSGSTIDADLNVHDFDINLVRDFIKETNCIHCKSNIATILSQHIDHVLDHKYFYKKKCESCNKDIINKQSTKDHKHNYHHYSCFKYQEHIKLHNKIQLSETHQELASFCNLNNKKK